MPEQPIPEQDPIVSKSYALYYAIAMVLLMATLFWALWDEAAMESISGAVEDALYVISEEADLEFHQD